MTIESIATTFAGLVLVYLLRQIMALRDDVKKIHIVLFGPNDDTGLYQTVQELQNAVRLRAEFRGGTAD